MWVSFFSVPLIVAANLSEEGYKFIDNLLALEIASNPVLSPSMDIKGFLPLSEWAPFLNQLPDKRFEGFLRRGICSGFRIGVPPYATLKSKGSNNQSALSMASEVDKYISDEIKAGTLIVSDQESVHASPIGFIPKKNRPGKFRMIVNLSSPSGFSVNDNINPDHSSFNYITVRQVAELIPHGWFMAKLDLKSAYRKVPVHHADSHFLGISWKGNEFLDRALPFGLRSAPIIFNAVADGLAWAMICSGIVHLAHYLDDFIFWAQDATSCRQILESAVSLAGRLGLPVEPTKVEGPSSTLIFLGIEIDSVARELRLPKSKLLRLKDIIFNWSKRRAATRHHLEVIIGLLNDAAKVVPAGRPFIRNLIDAKSPLREPSHFVRLNSGCKADIAWWAAFIEGWNGVGIIPPDSFGPSITSDASGSWGCGAFISINYSWFQVKWPEAWSSVNIAAKELFPIVVAISIWGPFISEKCIFIYSDNSAVVSTLSSRSAKDKFMSHLLRCLFFFMAHYNVAYRVFHLAGKRNSAADALSRNKLSDFLSIFPQAPKTPSLIPPSLLSMLFNLELQWTSDRWRGLFRASLALV